MTAAVGTITHTRGETITFGLRQTPEFDGTETVTCDVKVAKNGKFVPDPEITKVVSASATFIAASAPDPAYWSFTITETQSDGMEAGNYILDAKIVESGSNNVIIVSPLKLALDERVTET